MRILGVDFGSKRIGIAVSDELFITAQGVKTLVRRSLEQDLREIKDFIKEHGVIEVVVGLPLNMNGSHSQKTKEAMEFMESLSKAVDVPVKTWDERLSTVQAERTLLEADLSRAKRKRV
ncbi:MAG: Holliday junction resolvase RuvX, partial [Candidatus Omnitrophota bacterium]